MSHRLLTMVSPERARLRNIIRTTKLYDMAEEENERFFLKIYMHYIGKMIEHNFGSKKLDILDAGCGQGRIAIPLAKIGHRVTGIDVSQRAIDKARLNAESDKLHINFIPGSIEGGISCFPLESFDCVISTEVLYMVSNYEKVIESLVRLVKYSGLVILSLRPRLYYVLVSLLGNQIEKAAKLVMQEGNYTNEGFSNCQGRDEMMRLMESNGLKDIETRGIGILSGVEGDPQSKFVIPSRVDQRDLDLLLSMEIRLGEQFSDNARYVLVSGVKR